MYVFQKINNKVTKPIKLFSDEHQSYRRAFTPLMNNISHESAILEKVQLVKIYRNFLQPKFTKKNKHDEFAHLWSPAMYLKIVDNILSFEDVFKKRLFRSHFVLDDRENNFLDRHYPFSRQKMAY